MVMSPINRLIINPLISKSTLEITSSFLIFTGKLYHTLLLVVNIILCILCPVSRLFITDAFSQLLEKSPCTINVINPDRANDAASCLFNNYLSVHRVACHYGI